ncbi:hypothetical protein GPECTOR_1g246 [Gonium pectorale]|uniref:Spermatogenesis-associated protein 17 n=1 Tax=Gonium pectorale TaxID=33097 RepID=A0A150H2H7_GONPE|nr:hypothetical protein GPECTOR_1g246 [Gonium pectorale]|eukprot:KXZ56281.1 hypothetical protein GPECTOR_1g246 [Gonium pectorale]
MAALATLEQVHAPALIQEYFSKCRWTVLTIQRYWRGYLGRLRGKLALEVYDRALRKAYFNRMATVIQRWWRGYYSRKHIHDYYARKRYLQQVKQRNHQIRAELNMEAERAIIMQRQEAEERARKLFADKLSKLHHLVSTSSQPGIFNSPYSIATGTLPVIMGLPVEDHLKTAVKSQLSIPQPPPPSAGQRSHGGGSLAGSGRLPPLNSMGSKVRGGGLAGSGPLRGGGSPASRTGSAGAAGGGLGSTGQRAADAPLYGATAEVAGKTVPARQTLRQTADFEALHREALLEEKVHRGEMLSHHPQAFTTALGAVKAPFFDLQSNRNLLPYNDPYDPTVGIRGPRFTPDQQTISNSAFNRYIKRQPMFDKNMAAAEAIWG